MLTPFLVLIPERKGTKSRVSAHQDLYEFLMGLSMIRDSRSIIGRFSGELEMGVAVKTDAVEDLIDVINANVALKNTFYIMSDTGGFQYQNGHLMDIRMVKATYEEAAESTNWFTIGNDYYILPATIPASKLA